MIVNELVKELKPVPTLWDPVFFMSKRRPSAVLVLFVLNQQEREILFIRRSTRTGSHRGQIGFPGGRLEDGDTNPAMTALRETREEIGLDPEKINIMGLSQTVQALDGSLVYPVFAWAYASDCQTTPSPSEVQDVLRVPADRLSVANCQKFSFNMFGCWRDSFLYDCSSFNVWGLSAEILAKAGIY